MRALVDAVLLVVGILAAAPISSRAAVSVGHRPTVNRPSPPADRTWIAGVNFVGPGGGLFP